MSHPTTTAPVASTTPNGKTCSLDVDGQEFDITNLLGSLPDEDCCGRRLPKPVSTRASTDPTSNQTFGKRDAPPRLLVKYPSISQLLLGPSSHHQRAFTLYQKFGFGNAPSPPKEEDPPPANRSSPAEPEPTTTTTRMTGEDEGAAPPPPTAAPARTTSNNSPPYGRRVDGGRPYMSSGRVGASGSRSSFLSSSFADASFAESSMSDLTMPSFLSDLHPPALAELQESVSSFSEAYVMEQANAHHAARDTVVHHNHRQHHPYELQLHQCEPPPPQQQQVPKEAIEVSPGVFLPFRGSDETWDCIKTGRGCTVQCLECSLDIVVAHDCSYAICPDCHTLNPMAALLADRNENECFGVLMGFKKDWCGDHVPTP